MSVPTAILLPGQGTPMDGAGEEVARLRPDLLAEVIAAVGEDPFPRTGESTRFAQPAIVASSLTRFSALGLPPPDAILGHSVGEIAALAIGGAIGEQDALRLAAARGAAMADADPERIGSMAALRRGGLDAARELAEAHGLVVACDNAPGQVILSGRIDDLDAAAEAAKAAGNRLRRLDVAGAFHSPLMVPAAAGLQTAIDRVAIGAPHARVFSSVTGKPVTDPAVHLIDGLTNPVLFRPGLLALYADGIRRFVDVGPGDVVAGLARRSFPEGELSGADAVVVEVPDVPGDPREGGDGR